MGENVSVLEEKCEKKCICYTKLDANVFPIDPLALKKYDIDLFLFLKCLGLTFIFFLINNLKDKEYFLLLIILIRKGK